MKAKLSPEAEADLYSLIEWYESRQYGLGLELAKCVDAALDTVCCHPKIGTNIHGDEKRVIVRRFPISIYYRVTDVIYVRAIFHQKVDVSGN